MRLALFGGTFDPVHSGHVAAAVAAADECRLDQVLVVPTGVPPHKPAACRAPYEHRFRMVELACAADPRLVASRLEEPRTDGGPHYTVDTVRSVRSAMAFEPPLRFVIGTDAFAEVDLWRDSEGVRSLLEFVVVGRPGSTPERVLNWVTKDTVYIPSSHPASSHAVRHRAKIGGSLADLAPAPVCEYIWEHGLYRHADPSFDR